MSSKIIIIATIILLIACFSVLFVIEARNHDYDYGKSWSVVYFENPRDNSLDFAIENHEGKESTFEYKVFVNEEKMIGSEVNIAKGATQKIAPILELEKWKGKSMVVALVEVSLGGAEYRIYKNIQ